MKFVFILLLLSACSTVRQTLDTDVFYKRDVGIEVNGQYFEGVTVVPYSRSYSITLLPKGEIDLMLIRTCHREYAVEKASGGWKLFGGKKNKFEYIYTPIQGIEDNRACPLRVEVYESSKGRNSWALIDMENPKYKLIFNVDCNGDSYTANGVAACQAKEKSIQRVKFSEPIRFAPSSDGCQAPMFKDGYYEIQASIGECPYTFDTKDGKTGRITIIGWQGVLIREAQ